MRVGLVFLTSALLASCATAPKQTLIAAAGSAAEAAAAQATIDIGLPPAECGIPEPHAPLIIGRNVHVILKRERAQKLAETESKLRCDAWFKALRETLLSKGDI